MDKRWLGRFCLKYWCLLANAGVKIALAHGTTLRPNAKKKKKIVFSFGTLSLKSVMQFSCIYCGIRLIQFLKDQLKKAMVTQVATVSLSVFTHPDQRAK